MMKKVVIYSIVCAVILGWGIAFSQEKEAPRKQAGNKAGEEYTRDERVPQLYKRLADVIQALKLKPDDEGKYSITISKDNRYDLVDRVFLLCNKRAEIHSAQGRVSKIAFKYYQFNMTTQVRELKTITATAPDSGDLGSLTIEYENNTGQKEKFTLSDLERPDSRRDVIKQYYSYYLALVYRLELYKDSSSRLESSKIKRAIQLGE
ncbi:MAG: hypothetical protein KA369_04490 [Spirochaetes bacterium]|nr:hypothetical protein [Spirochaetota bacterium]